MFHAERCQQRAGEGLEQCCLSSSTHLGLRCEVESDGQTAVCWRWCLAPDDLCQLEEKGPEGGRDAHLSWSTLAARKGRCWGYAADLITQRLSAQSSGYYLHCILLRLGPKKIHRTAVGLWKLFSSVWLLKMNLHQSFHASLPLTPSPLVSAILSERQRRRAGRGQHPHPALFLCPMSHPENAKCFTKVAEVGAVHRL